MTPRAELLETWARGYALVRGYERPRPVEEGLWMAVGKPDQHGRYVVQGFDPAVIRGLAARVDRPGIYLEIAAARERVMPLLGPGWTARERAWLMARALTAADERPCPAGYVLRSTADGPVLGAEIRDRSGTVAASGTAGLVGDACVFDRIVTDDNHRRRGLGSAVMAALTRGAAEASASRGVLIATPDGRALYGAIGWRVETEITSAISSAALAPSQDKPGTSTS